MTRRNGFKIRHLWLHFLIMSLTEVSLPSIYSSLSSSANASFFPFCFILVPRALLTRGQPSATRGSGQIHIKLASDWPQRNIWFIVNMNKNTQALHEALVSLWRKLGEKTLLKLKEQQYEAVRKIVVDNRPQKR